MISKRWLTLNRNVRRVFLALQASVVWAFYAANLTRSWTPLRRLVVKTFIWLFLFQPGELP